jgi:hypothetical protein
MRTHSARSASTGAIALWAARELGGSASSAGRTGACRSRYAPKRPIRHEPDFILPPMPIGESTWSTTTASLSLSLKAHPLSFLRDRFDAAIVEAESLRATANGRRVTVAGLVLVASGPARRAGSSS